MLLHLCNIYVHFVAEVPINCDVLDKEKNMSKTNLWQPSLAQGYMYAAVKCQALIMSINIFFIHQRNTGIHNIEMYAFYLLNKKINTMFSFLPLFSNNTSTEIIHALLKCSSHDARQVLSEKTDGIVDRWQTCW